MGQSLTHIRVLDGIRGLAILLVLLHHNLGTFTIQTRSESLFKLLFTSHGWMGVNLFFVLSGFLITGILLQTKEDPKYFRNFYMRRVLRIFPLYYSVIFLSFFILPHLGQFWAHAFRNASTELPWYLSYTMNHRAGLTVPMGHFWSLCVEEQFYLLWPFIIWSFSRQAITTLCVAGICISPVIRWFLLSKGHDISFYSVTHLDALFWGAILAVANYKQSGLLKYRSLASSGFIFSGSIVAAIYALERLRLTPESFIKTSFFYSFIDLFFAALLVLVISAKSTDRFTHFFKNRFLCWLGKYSYGIYVYHVLVVVFLAYVCGGEEHIMPKIWGSQIPFVIIFGITVSLISCGIAYLSYHLMEKRFLLLKRYF